MGVSTVAPVATEVGILRVGLGTRASEEVRRGQGSTYKRVEYLAARDKWSEISHTLLVVCVCVCVGSA